MNYVRTPRDAESRAIDRDLRDTDRLTEIADLIAVTLDALIPLMPDLEHPRAAWQPDDLVVALQEQLQSCRFEIQRVTTGPLVIEDDDQ